MTRALLVLLALATAAPAAAQGEFDSRRRGSFEFRVLPYKPDIDGEFDGAASPYDAVFGGSRRYMVRGDFGWTLLRHGLGSLDAGLGVGYFQARGRGLLPDGNRSADATALRIVPTTLSLTYRVDVLSRSWSIPFAFYGRAAFERYNWWITKGSGGTASAGGESGAGATNGYSFGGGVALLLDFIDRKLAVEMDRDTGINDTYLYFDVTKAVIDDFGSSSSFDLSPDEGFTIGAGLLFVF